MSWRERHWGWKGCRAGALWFCLVWVMGVGVRGDVRVWVEGGGGFAWVRYACDGGEVVRAFGLDVWVDRGVIEGVSDYVRGESVVGGVGYGFFPGSFDRYVVPGLGGGVDWGVEGYGPVAFVDDDPLGTLGGLGTSGVTLELGGVWESGVGGVVPGVEGVLCRLELSEAAVVSVGANLSRGGVVTGLGGVGEVVVFEGAFIGPAVVEGVWVEGGVVRVEFTGGELEVSGSVEGPWESTGGSSGVYEELVQEVGARFFRVRAF